MIYITVSSYMPKYELLRKQCIIKIRRDEVPQDRYGKFLLIFYAPAIPRMVEGHLVLPLSVRPSIRASVRYQNLVSAQ